MFPFLLLNKAPQCCMSAINICTEDIILDLQKCTSTLLKSKQSILMWIFLLHEFMLNSGM